MAIEVRSRNKLQKIVSDKRVGLRMLSRCLSNSRLVGVFTLEFSKIVLNNTEKQFFFLFSFFFFLFFSSFCSLNGVARSVLRIYIIYVHIYKYIDRERKKEREQNEERPGNKGQRNDEQSELEPTFYHSTFLLLSFSLSRLLLFPSHSRLTTLTTCTQDHVHKRSRIHVQSYTRSFF